MNKTKILVADDDRSICTLIKLILEKEGFEVSCLFDGESVVNEIAAGGKYGCHQQGQNPGYPTFHIRLSSLSRFCSPPPA